MFFSPLHTGEPLRVIAESERERVKAVELNAVTVPLAVSAPYSILASIPKRTSCENTVCEVIFPIVLYMYEEFPLKSLVRLKCLPVLSELSVI